eukprot:gene16912-3955_t
MAGLCGCDTGPKPAEDVTADLATAMAQMNGYASGIAKEASKLTMSFSAFPIEPKEFEPISKLFFQQVLGLSNHWAVMVTFEGPQMQRQIGMNIARTLQSAALFVNALRHAYSTKTPMKADSADMVGTGELFSACERLQCTPQTNRTAICNELSSEIVVLKDCLGELDDTYQYYLVESNHIMMLCRVPLKGLDELDDTYQYYLVESAKEEAEAKAKAEADAAGGVAAATDAASGEWSELDAEGVQYAVALLKVSVKTAGKVLEFLVKTPPTTVDRSAPEVLAAEVKLGVVTAQLGRYADDMAAESYPPINPGDMKPTADAFNAQLTTVSKAMAELATAQNPEVDVPKWVEFLNSATVHNYAKLDAALSGSIGGMGLRTNVAC